jgi:hypothetical protein
VATSDKVAGAEQRAGQFARGNKKYARKKNPPDDLVVLRAMREAERAVLSPRKQPGDRACLGCGRLFASKWCGNRLCASCGDRP